MIEDKKEGYPTKRYPVPTKRYCQKLNLKNNPELIAISQGAQQS